MKFLVTLLLALSLSAQATTITVHDGESFEYNSGVDVFFDATLSATNPTVTFGVKLDSSESFNFVVTTPTGFPSPGLFALLSKGSNFGEGLITSPVSQVFPLPVVDPSTSFTFILDGGYPDEQWISLGLWNGAWLGDEITTDISGFLAGLPDNELPIGQVVSSSSQNFTYYSGDGSGSGAGGSGSGAGGNTPVPEPSTLLALFLGLLVLGIGAGVRSRGDGEWTDRRQQAA